MRGVGAGAFDAPRGGALVHGGPLPKGGDAEAGPLARSSSRKPQRKGAKAPTVAELRKRRDFRHWLMKMGQRLVHLYGASFYGFDKDKKTQVSFTGCCTSGFLRPDEHGEFTDAVEVHRHGELESVLSGSKSFADYSFVGLAHCGNPWLCPVCAPIVGARRLDEIQKSSMYLLKRGYSYLFCTYTASHDYSVKLADFQKKFSEAKREFKKSASFKAVQKKWAREWEIVSTEVTDDDPKSEKEKRTGWHLHDHTLIFLKRPFLTEDEVAEFQSLMSKGWQEACKKAGLKTSLERGIYIESIQEHAKKTGLIIPFDELPKKKQKEYIDRVSEYFTKSMGFELTGATRKTAKKGKYGVARVTPWDLLLAAVKGDVRARERWLEYGAAMRRKPLIRFSPGLRDFCHLDDGLEKEEEDQDLMRGRKGTKIFGFGWGELLLPDDFQAVMRQGRLGHLLSVVDQADRGMSPPQPVAAAKAFCSLARQGYDILTGEKLGAAGVNPVWAGGDDVPVVAAGVEPLSGERVFISSVADQIRLWRDEQAELARKRHLAEWDEKIARASAVGSLGSLWDDAAAEENLDLISYAREKVASSGGDPDVVLPLSSPWVGNLADTQPLLPGFRLARAGARPVYLRRLAGDDSIEKAEKRAYEKYMKQFKVVWQ